MAGSKNIIGKVLSSPKDKVEADNNKKVEPKKPILMTRRELTDPFGSDEEDAVEPLNDNKTDAVIMNGNKESDQKEESKDLPKPNIVNLDFPII